MIKVLTLASLVFVVHAELHRTQNEITSLFAACCDMYSVPNGFLSKIYATTHMQHSVLRREQVLNDDCELSHHYAITALWNLLDFPVSMLIKLLQFIDQKNEEHAYCFVKIRHPLV